MFNTFTKRLNKLKTQKRVAVIGAGVSGLSAASALAAKGYRVSVFEKNDHLGGRLAQFNEGGFIFDMGPSWYWMPEILERYFNTYNYTSSDFYSLIKLDPGFQVIFKNSSVLRIPEDWEELLTLFESIETGAADNLKKFMRGAEYKYKVGMNNLVYKPGLSFTELITPETVQGFFKLQVFSSFSRHVRKYFKDERLISLMEFPVLFLGAMPKETPALYSLMNYTGLRQGTYYPMGGFKKVADAMAHIAKENGAEFFVNEPVTSISPQEKEILVKSSTRSLHVDGLIAAADYHHVENRLLSPSFRNYTANYWEGRSFAPSCLLFYIGVDKKIPKLEHHNLFFDEDFNQHAEEIHIEPKWPTKPLFYVCCPSKTDPSVAPIGKENLFVLMPIAAGLEDDESIRQSYFDILMHRLEKFTGANVRMHIEFKRSYCVKDFKKDYNSFKGNAYGLANTLRQTAILKPKLKNKAIDSFYYAGQLTVPGPGVPPAVISGQVAAAELIKDLER